MSLSSENTSKNKDVKPKANESDWYNQHYESSGMKASCAPLTEPDLTKHLGPWYSFALPYLRDNVNRDERILELGCGTGRLLVQVFREGLSPAENLYGIDQSSVAIQQAKEILPAAHFSVGDIYDLKIPKAHFNFVLLMEVIEHLESPEVALKQINSVLVPGGHLILSFPNFVHLPWLVVRILSEKLNRPNWIVLQPIDKIYTVWDVRKLAEAAGFSFKLAIGSNYGPPLLYKWERPGLTRTLNKLGLWWLSFHPILIFKKERTV